MAADEAQNGWRRAAAAMPKAVIAGPKPGHKCYIGRVPDSFTDDDLRDHFSQFGELNDSS